MDKAVLLAEIRATIASVPDFDTHAPASRTHLEWLGRVGALLSRWDGVRAIVLRPTMIHLLAGSGAGGFHLNMVLAELHGAEADLALDVPSSPQQVFGPGAVYDFLRSLRDILSGATNTLFVVDPYLDGQIFDAYLSTVSPQVAVRLLTHKHGQELKASLEKFVAQGRPNVTIRKSGELHDRLVIVDAVTCWVLGQSIKDAATKAPTYIAPLAADAAELKRAAYEAIWTRATPL
jgi:hypothetical protein